MNAANRASMNGNMDSSRPINPVAVFSVSLINPTIISRFPLIATYIAGISSARNRIT